MNTGICYIFGAGDRTLCHIELTEEDLVIAADGGFDFLEEIGLRADCVLEISTQLNPTTSPLTASAIQEKRMTLT